MIAPTETQVRDWSGHLTALPTERIHSLLRRMSDQDWFHLKALLSQNPSHAATGDIDILERMFRKGEALAGQAGGTIFRVVQTIVASAPLLEEVRKANERIRTRVRFALREMSDSDWAAFQRPLAGALSEAGQTDEIRVLNLVYRIGESVSNVEIAATALADKLSGRKWIAPEVARHNALVKAQRSNAEAEAEAAYVAAKRAADEREEIARRAENTLAYSYVEPTQAFKHARNTVFKIVDVIADSPELMAEVARIEQELLAVPPLSRDQMRWAMHRMPKPQRFALIKLIPLNTILMFQPGEAGAKLQDRTFRAARDRLLAYDLFVRGQSDEELAQSYGLSINAAKNTVGMILETLIAKPLARKLVHEYLAHTEKVPPMTLDEVRRTMKRISTRQRAEILERIPNCSWKARHAMPLHKHLFLDYLSGEWVLGALVAYYNLQKDKRLTGLFKLSGTLTVRGANSAMEGMLRKIADEPDLRQQLKDWSNPKPSISSSGSEPLPELAELPIGELVPPAPKPSSGPSGAATADEVVLVEAAA